MPRADLLALSADDLTTLTNRGTVKRAQREVETNEFTCDLSETPEGAVTAQWSDGVECHLPAGAVVRDGRCSCAAAGLCRHIVRTVLAYQRQAAQASPGEPPAPAEPWDPGAISDDELARHYRPAALNKMREQFSRGVLVELVRSSKPSAHFHLQACLLRFLVPGDPRYTHCDCHEAPPCAHVPLAVWAFRALDAGKQAGILATGEKAPPAPADLLDDLESAVLQLTEYGVSGAPSAWLDALTRLEGKCRTADLVWPAEVLAELIQQQERYAGHDARFAPDRVAALVGELLIRLDAIRHDTGALPQLLVRGAGSDRATALGAARFVGLGCGAHTTRRSVELTAYLQDTDSGSMVAVTKEFREAEPDPTQPAQAPRSFADLAHAPAVKGSSFASLGAGQLLIRGGKRTAGYHLLPGRAEVIAGVQAAHFEASTQTVRAVLLDARGQRALLAHPFTARGQAGAEALLSALTAKPEGLRFVSGPVQRSAQGLVIHPVCTIWQEGARRTALQPWVEQRPGAGGGLETVGAATGDPLGDYLAQLQAGLGELFVLGLQRADGQAARRWRDLQRQGEAVGFARLAGKVAGLADALGQKGHTLDWDWQAAGRALLGLAVLARMAQDLAG